jgi:hypothetical protein
MCGVLTNGYTQDSQEPFGTEKEVKSKRISADRAIVVEGIAAEDA